ncbi:MAG: hypothetical protein IJM67_05650 [Atopobiaceae bacterium]|nr:hypothetical protein [Atopobiaceae bacterium]
MDEKSSPRNSRKLATAVVILLAVCLIAFLASRHVGDPDAPATGAATQTTLTEDDGQEEPEELPMRAPTGIAMQAEQANDALNIERAQPGGKRPTNLSGDTWTVFVYLCGSDLESRSGAGSKDLNEMLSGSKGSNVRFVVETGGARTWRNNTMSNRKLGRYLIQNGQIQEVGSVSPSSMGAAATLADFLTWGIRNYPAEHMGLILWDHGGGSITGVCFDELNRRDSLYLRELDTALNQAYGVMWDKFDFIGFDACLMCTLETANVMATYADYMVASQESEPGNGWEYGSIARYLSQNPGCDGRDLGRIICDSYLASQPSSTRGFVTLALIDLSKIDPLLEQYYRFSREMYDLGSNQKNLAAISRNMQQIDNYGCNNRREGYTNMVDLGGLVTTCASAAPSAGAVQAALYDAVVYQIRGTYHAGACGLSTYYPLYINGKNELSIFQTVAVNPSYLAYVDRLAHGATSGNTQGYSPTSIWQDSLWNWLLGNSQEVQEQVEDNWNYVDNHNGTAQPLSFATPPQVDGEGTFWFQFDQAGIDRAAVVSAYVYQLSDDGKHAIAMGETYDVYGDWETGQFSDGFSGYWLSLPDGQSLNLTVQSADESTIVYTSPIELNGEECYLRMRQDVSSGRVTVEGAWGALGANGAVDRSMRPIESGDTILPLYRAVTVAESQPVDDYEGELYTVGANGLEVSYGYLPVGTYLYSFCIQDVFGNAYCTESVQFEIDENGDIYF